MRIRGFEPPRRQPTHGPEPCASANSAISAHWLCVVHATVLIYIIWGTNASIIFTFFEKSWARHKPGSVLDDHLSRLTVTGKLQPSTYRAATGRRFLRPIWCCSEWGLHEKYVTIPPCELLPHNFNLTTALPVSAECFCCTFPTVTCAGRYPASLPCGARTFLIHPEDARDRLSYPNIFIS